ncbi:origin recognition complex subunit 2-like isoform X2 [Prorops nasuta]|uniref:origin recognition complex subunit 2-like isoform X2 n=1 Tax=Prorops nasuta TaxID=863751 RepID=UPI0034CEC637
MSLRRSGRIKAITEAQELINNYKDQEENLFMEEIEKELETIDEDIQKPSELFTAKDVSGNKIYSFQTPRQNRMIEKANSCFIPMIEKTPEKLPRLKIVLERSDDIINVQERFKPTLISNKKENVRRLSKLKSVKTYSESSSTESESVSEGSEYAPSDSDSEETDFNKEYNDPCDDRSSDDSDDLVLKKTEHFKSSCKQLQISRQCKRPMAKYSHNNYHMDTDDYFEAQLRKNITSGHTLKKLVNPKLTEGRLNQLLNNPEHISVVHGKCMRTLFDRCENDFTFWNFLLEEGHNLLLYGLGSKRCLINEFHKSMTFNHPTVVVNGFFPSLTLKDILDEIINQLLNTTPPGGMHECVNLIQETMRKNPDDRLYLLIHNIDGLTLRSSKLQTVLAHLASIPNVRLVASVDHINSSLIWDQIKRWQLRFYWWDASTLLPYETEISYESSLLVQKNGALALSSLYNVFRSLTSNAKSIYIILAKFQLENDNNKNYMGMLFKHLYRAAREAFVVSSDSSLRAQLTEFLDHKLINMKRKVDGAEYLLIPLQSSLLQEFLDEQETA